MKLYTKEEAAAELKIGKRTLERLISTGELGAYRVGGSIRISDEHIEFYLVNNAVKVHGQTQGQTQGQTGSRRRKKQTPRIPYVPGMKVV